MKLSSKANNRFFITLNIGAILLLTGCSSSMSGLGDLGKSIQKNIEGVLSDTSDKKIDSWGDKTNYQGKEYWTTLSIESDTSYKMDVMGCIYRLDVVSASKDYVVTKRKDIEVGSQCKKDIPRYALIGNTSGNRKLVKFYNRINGGGSVSSEYELVLEPKS